MKPTYALLLLAGSWLMGCTAPAVRLAPSARQVSLLLNTPGDYSGRQQVYHDPDTQQDVVIVPDAARQRFCAYDLRTQQESWYLPLPAALASRISYLKLRPLTRDSLFVLDRVGQQLLLLNPQGHVQHRWPVQAPGLVLGDVPAPLFYHRNSLYAQQLSTVRGFLTQPTDRERFYRTPPLVRLALGDTTVARLAVGQYPRWFSADCTYATFEPNVALNTRGEWLVGYAPSDSVWLYGPAGLVRVARARSRWHRPMQPFPSDSLPSSKFRDEYGVTQSQYHTLTYDPYRHLYYRVYIHGVPARRPDGSLNTNDDQPWSLLVLNEDLQLVGETRLPAHYDYNTLLIVPAGVWIGSHRPGHPGFDSQRLQLTLFTHAPR